MSISMDKLASFCKKKGFIFPSSEIYGGFANTWDYGPLGVELKNNIKNLWWKYFVHNRRDMTGIDGAIILNPDIWVASGHVENFKDPLVECKSCNQRFRPDKLEDDSKCPECGGELTKARMFSCLFQTTVGPVEGEGKTAFLRPETAQDIFVNFKNVLNSSNKKLPFGIGQMGKAFRNEVTAGQFIFRIREFEQMEIEYFFDPDEDWNGLFEEWLEYMYGFADLIGLSRENFYNHEIPEEERAFYSKRTIDLEYKYSFGTDELWAIAYRTDYDLSCHEKGAGEEIKYFDEKKNKKYVPHVIEPTFGVDRTILALLQESYEEEELKDGDKRIVLRFNPQVAPYKAAIFPLLRNKPELVEKSKEIFEMLKGKFSIEYDETGSIGKRYRRQDEAGTPFCITVDFDSLKNNDVTIRHRDSMEQERVKIKDLENWLKEKI